ncbi:MAG: polymer-forming cytoskeletal protein [Woeseiaceae bacterium]|nr:polymer-forming cytoskeletal protein [Woeseiaceae bacterium]
MNESKLRRMRDQSSGKATLINEGCKISGEITGNGDFMVNGEVTGDCDITGTLTLAGSGYWQGSIRADNVIVAGHVEGDIVARGKVEITNTARIAGTVTGEAIAVAEGAVVEGVMKTTGQAKPLGFVEKRDG